MRRCWFYVNNHFSNFYQIFTFWDPVSEKKRFLRRGLSVVCINTITFEKIIELDCVLAHFLKHNKERMSSLTSHFWSTILVLSIKNGFYKIKKSIFQSTYAIYEKMLRKKIVGLKKILQFFIEHLLIG